MAVAGPCYYAASLLNEPGKTNIHARRNAPLCLTMSPLLVSCSTTSSFCPTPISMRASLNRLTFETLFIISVVSLLDFMYLQFFSYSIFHVYFLILLELD